MLPHQLALVLDGDTTSLYINASPFVADKSLPQLRNNGSQRRLKLGSDEGPDRQWDEELKELDFFCGALAQDEVLAAMSASLGLPSGP